jgi:NO-binding membrane sensor protein with MHYT domain
MQVSDQPWLVLLSVAAAVAGGYVGLRLAAGIGAASGTRRRLTLAGAACALGAAVWAMHFTAMLSVRAPFALAFLALPTLLSFLICVIVAGVALHLASSGPLTPARLTLAACALGAGIFAAHAIAITALDASARVSLTPGFAAAGLIVAIALCAPALWLAIGQRDRPLLAALAFGVAVAAMHFTDMEGVTLAPRPAALPAPALSGGIVAIILAFVIFGVLGLFLLLLVPDRVEIGIESLKSAPAPTENDEAAVEAAVEAAAPASGSDADLRRGIYAPLGGAGAPPPRLAEHLPIERDGATHFLPVEDVVAVQANAHYTFLFDGSAKLFCPLAIGEVESRLDRSRFMRVHRSHIVNIERVTGFKRSGDSETVELAADEHYAVPVSRSRAGSLKARIGEKNGGSGPQT